ncbi:hypothetical protein [Patulibacter americanus]|uniref:hypothetical protein n=1 Tax=Patulibacter americanus TaxID=588672 RepID=UPI0003B4ECDD|nr:hypothetical protein [Patulibacter americanus]
MKVLETGPVPDRTVPLIQVWEQAFLRPTVWREALHAGMTALVETLEADPQVCDACVLARLPASVDGPVVWHRELTRGRVLRTLTAHWYRCGGARVPELSFEMFLGEVCTLLQDCLDDGGSFSDLPDEAVSLWGQEPSAAGRRPEAPRATAA